MNNQQQTDVIMAQMADAIKFLSDTVTLLERHADRMAEDKATPLSDLGEFYFKAVDAHEKADKVVKRAYHVKDRYNKGVIPEALTENNTDGFRIPSIARSFSVVKKTSASFIDKEAGLEWLRSIGQGDMIQPTVNAGTLSTFCRNMLLEEGIEPPEDIVKLNTYNTTSMVKYTPKG